MNKKQREDFVNEVSDHWAKASPDPLTRHMMREGQKKMVQTFRLTRALEQIRKHPERIHPEWDTGRPVGQEVW